VLKVGAFGHYVRTFNAKGVEFIFGRSVNSSCYYNGKEYLALLASRRIFVWLDEQGAEVRLDPTCMWEDCHAEFFDIRPSI
jgi:hypothetical protein